MLISVILFAGGPWNFPIQNPMVLFFYLILSFFLLSLGYFIGVNKSVSLKPIYDTTNSKSLIRLLKLSIVIYIFLIPFTLYARTGSYFYDFSSISDLGKSYNDTAIWYSNRGFVIGEYLRIIFSPFLFAYLPLGIMYWKKLNRVYKLSFVIGLLSFLTIDFLNGTNRTLADFLIYSMVLFILSIVKKSRSESNNRIVIDTKIKKKLIRTFIILIILFTIFINFFIATISTRAGGLTTETSNYTLNIEHPSLALFSNPETKIAIGVFISYLTQGYYALGLSFDKPFESTFGFGNSAYTLMSTKSWFDTDYFINRSYLSKNYISNGWDYQGKWSSIYVWIGNDVSLWGVLIVFLFIGIILGNCWRNIVLFDDIPSLILFCQIVLLCFYIPANNQIMQIAENYFGFIFWLGVWLISIPKRKRKLV